MFHFERRHEPLATTEVFRLRMLTGSTVAFGLVVLSLAAGIAGYVGFEDLSFLDAFLNSAMLLSGMGPLHAPVTTAGKVFAALYALYSGFAVLVIAAILLAPVAHRLFHRFHVEEEEDSD